MAVRQVIGRGALTLDDVGALAEFLKHCAGYARDVGTALIQSTPEGTK